MATERCVRDTALSLVGKNYKLGEEFFGYVVGVEQTKDPDDGDCSALPYSVFRKCGVLVDGKPFPRETADDYFRRATAVSVSDVRCGDLGFLLRDGHCYHTFLVVGPGQGLDSQVVEAGDGTGHVGLRTVQYENARPGIRWGRLNHDIEKEGEMTEDEVRAIVREEMAIIWSSTVKTDQQYLVTEGIVSASRPPEQIASVGYVDSLAARVLRRLKGR